MWTGQGFPSRLTEMRFLGVGLPRRVRERSQELPCHTASRQVRACVRACTHVYVHTLSSCVPSLSTSPTSHDLPGWAQWDKG